MADVIEKLIEKFYKTATEHMDAGSSYEADPYYKCGKDLKSALPAIRELVEAAKKAHLRLLQQKDSAFLEDADLIYALGNAIKEIEG
jgi:hypothetical protein